MIAQLYFILLLKLVINKGTVKAKKAKKAKKANASFYFTKIIIIFI